LSTPAAASQQVVTSDDALGDVVATVVGEGRMALDTEFMRERTYRAHLCLVQIATREEVFLVDPVPGVDLGRVAALLADSRVEVVVHAGRQDLDIFHDAFGVVPRRIFDVQVAAGFTGFGGSLPYGRLVERVCGVTLAKGESYTDWCRRPLTAAQLRYAADDVRWLLDIADRLQARLTELQRTGWVAQELRAFERPESYGVDADRAYKKVASRGSLSARQTAVLKEVAGWRERAAADRNLPRGWLVKDPTLVEIARRQPGSIAALRSIRGLGERAAERWGRDILAAIERGQRAAPIEQDVAPAPKSVLVRARMMAGLADAVVRARCESAGIATELVTSRGETEALLADIFCARPDLERHRLLQGWRAELAGRSVTKLARGEIAVRAIDAPPYIEEVPI
jgi:ribonuclease D